MARLYAKLYNYQQAYRYLQEGIELAEETGSKLSLAYLYFTAGKLFLNNHVNKDIALEYLLEARNLFSEMDNWGYIHMVNICIGDVHYITGNDSIAMQYYKNATSTVYNTNYSSFLKRTIKLEWYIKKINNMILL